MSDHIEVTGTGSASATPDVVVITVRVQHDAANVGVVLSAVAERTTAVLAAALDHGIAAADRQTVTIGIHQRYDHQGQQVVGHTGFQTIRLICRAVDRVGEVLTALAEAGGDEVAIEGLGLELADPGPVRVLARERAFADAHATAEQLAALARRTLAAVTFITEGEAEGPGPQPRMFAMRADAAGMPIEAGESAVTVMLRVRWALQ